MKIIAAGNYIDQFLVEEVLRPLKNGNALLKVRYQGSYVRGYLCVVDARHYGDDYDTKEKLLHDLEELCGRFMTLDQNTGKVDCTATLPTRIFTCFSADGVLFALGYFNHKSWDNQSASQIMVLEDLAVIAEVLDAWHKKGIGHGAIHPQGILRAGKHNELLFSCPIFPVVLGDKESAWSYEFGSKSVTKDRKAFCQMIADVLTDNHDDKTFTKRLNNFEANVGAIPILSSFLSNPNISCKQLVDNAEVYRQKTNHAKKTHALKIRRKKSILWFAICTLVSLLVISSAAYFKEQWSREKLRVAVNENMAEARHAKDNNEWQVCRDKSQAVLVLQPNHAEAHSLQKEAVKGILVTKTLVEASDAVKNSGWQSCLKKADMVLGIEPQNKRALELKRLAENKIQYVSDMVRKARQAKSENNWNVCIEKAQEALTVQTRCAEATDLMVYAKNMLILEKLLVEAREAHDSREWALCSKKVGDALAIDKSNPTALELKNIAQNMLNKLSELRAQARKAKQSKNWQVCITKATEALSISPDNERFKELKSDAEKKFELKRLLTAAIQAKEKRDWQTCILNANAMLVIEPGHLEAKKVKFDAEHKKNIFAALISAREAKNTRQWKRCVEMATVAMEIEDEPEHSEALVLKSDAKRELTLINFLVAARAAKVSENWWQCKRQADKLLAVEPGNTEALELKSHAKKMLATTLSASALEAKKRKEWQVCFDSVNKLLSIEPDNIEAKMLLKQASFQIRLSGLLKECRDLKEKEKWQVCADRCSEVLRLDAGNIEAKALLEEATENAKPYLMFKVLYNNSEVKANFWDGVTVRDSSVKLLLKRNASYDLKFWYKSPRDPYGRVIALAKFVKLQSNWEGLKHWPIYLTDEDKLKESELYSYLKDWGVPSTHWFY